MIASEDMYTPYQVSPLREISKCNNALAFTRVPGVHYGHLEAILSG